MRAAIYARVSTETQEKEHTIGERNRRGRLYRARCGELVSPDIPFGYRRIPRRDSVAAHAEIDESEALVVRRIFDTYVNRGLTVRQIAKELTLERIPTPRKASEWCGSLIDHVLRSETY